MKENIKGTCHCDKVAIEITGEEKHTFLCHCDDCRKIHGGSRLTGIAFAKDAVNIAKGIPRKYVYDGGTGKIESFFCEDCGTPLYAYPLAHTDIVIVRANCLNDYDFKPREVMFKENLSHWDHSIEVN